MAAPLSSNAEQLWEIIIEMSKMRKVKELFFESLDSCHQRHPFDAQECIKALWECRQMMRVGYRDFLKEKREGKKVTYSDRKLLDGPVFIRWGLNIQTLRAEGKFDEFGRIYDSVMDIMHSTTQVDVPPLRFITQGVKSLTIGENHFRTALLWSQALKGYMLCELQAFWQREYGRQGEMTWDRFVNDSVQLNRKVAWKYQRLYWLIFDFPVRIHTPPCIDGLCVLHTLLFFSLGAGSAVVPRHNDSACQNGAFCTHPPQEDV